MQVAQNKRTSKLNKNYQIWYFFIIPMVFALILLIIGAFSDWQISKFIAGTDPKKTFGSYFSFIPGVLFSLLVGFVSLNIIFFWPFQIKNMKLKVLFYLVIFSILMPVMWYVFNDAFVKEIMDSFSIKNTYTSKEWNILWSLLTALGFVSLYIFSYYFWFRKIGFNRKYIWCYSLYALISLIIVAYLITLLKNHLPRERFYSIMAFHDGDQSYFRNWYSLIWNHSDGTGSRYTSFPSGHTTWAVALIIVIPFTFLNIKQKVWKWSVISFVYTILLITMFSRIQTGSHYLSDVSMSLFIGSFGYCGFYHLFNQILIRFKLS